MAIDNLKAAQALEQAAKAIGMWSVAWKITATSEHYVNATMLRGAARTLRRGARRAKK